jgi:two-component system NarL family sensor kinase
MSNEELFLSIVSVTLLVLLLMAIVAITFIISGRRKAMQENQLNQARLNFEKELRQVETEVSEHIMSQFAQELHDNIGQQLTALHIHIENQKLDDPAGAERFKLVDIYLDEINQQLRLLSRTFNNDFVGHLGLPGALQLEAERLNTLRRFTVHWKGFTGPSNLGKNQELMVFRIFQEIAQNALRHSGAKNFFMEVNNPGDDFELKVSDDGKGFVPEQVFNSQKASGLRNILKRSKMAGLSCQIESSPGNGCTYVFNKTITLD